MSRLPGILTVLTLVATGGLVLGLIIIAINPQTPLNPFPPPTSPVATPSPSVVPATRRPPTIEASPSATPSVYSTPTPLALAVPTPTPTPAFPFTSTVEARAVFECEEIALAGTVSDAEGESLEGYAVHVWGPVGETILMSGSTPDDGPGSWAYVLPRSKVPALSTWFIQLHRYDVYRSHPAVSPIVEVGLSGDCREALTLIHFRERADD